MAAKYISTICQRQIIARKVIFTGRGTPLRVLLIGAAQFISRICNANSYRQKIQGGSRKNPLNENHSAVCASRPSICSFYLHYINFLKNLVTKKLTLCKFYENTCICFKIIVHFFDKRCILRFAFNSPTKLLYQSLNKLAHANLFLCISREK